MRSPASSPETLPAEEPLQALISEELQKLPPGVHVDLGPILPASYGVDRLVLMVQDPFHVFAYWEITEDLRIQALSRFPEEDRADFQMVLEWCELESGQQITFDLGTLTCWWFETNPSSHYDAQLCFYSELYGAVPFLKSNYVETPRYSIELTQQLPEEEQDTKEWLNQLLDLTGVGKMKSLTDPVFAQTEEPVPEPVSPRELEDTPHANGQAPEDLHEDGSVRTGPLACSWPTS